MSTIATPRSARCLPSDALAQKLGDYIEPLSGGAREVVAVPGAEGATLVLDRAPDAMGDARVLARLAADEPSENARIVCSLYLADERFVRCRRLAYDDLNGGRPAIARPEAVGLDFDRVLEGGQGKTFRIVALAARGLTAARWTRLNGGGEQTARLVCLREVVGSLESYDPAITMTRAALEHYRACDGVSVLCLRAELARVLESPIVPNCLLREAVQRLVQAGELSMSEIALRCGRRKHDGKGHVSGDTSWLARRIGVLPESGQAQPTPWVHSDVLALIAREGLGVSPQEVELPIGG